MTGYNTLRVALEDGVLLIRLHRPEKRNALDDEMQRELADALGRGAEDPAVRGLVITGSGEAFSAGGDLSRFEREWTGSAFRAYSHELTRVITFIERMEKPVIAAVNGLATGAGTQLALACDLRLAARGAKFLLREGRIGLIPSHGGCVRLVKLVGLGRARDILLGSEELDAERAFQYGLITRVVEPDELLDAAREQLALIWKRAPQAYGLAKRLLLLAASVDMESGFFAESLAQSLLVQSADHREGVRAVREKREPKFGGN